MTESELITKLDKLGYTVYEETSIPVSADGLIKRDLSEVDQNSLETCYSIYDPSGEQIAGALDENALYEKLWDLNNVID